jgi:aryl-alcohol dehydrogenase-like predicted oxidoreductase
MAEVALAWVTDRPGVTSTILGARTVAQLEANLRSDDLVLEDAERRRLDEVSAVPVGDYPYGALGISQQERRLDGS